MAAPKKYVKIGGVMKLNPEFKAWQESQTGVGTATSLSNSAQALPVVSSMEDHMQMNSDLGTNMPLAESTDATIEMMQDDDFCKDAGMNSDTMVDELGSVLSKYEVPMGLMNKVCLHYLVRERERELTNVEEKGDYVGKILIRDFHLRLCVLTQNTPFHESSSLFI